MVRPRAALVVLVLVLALVACDSSAKTQPNAEPAKTDPAKTDKTLTEDTPEGMKGEVKWNFTKFLLDPAGKVVARFESPIEPMSAEVITAVEKALPAKS